MASEVADDFLGDGSALDDNEHAQLRFEPLAAEGVYTKGAPEEVVPGIAGGQGGSAAYGTSR